ncbi:unnamed protein product [Fusarium graminearum]|nr:unnamed protein product [Fusarium graminearum]
MDGLKAIPTLWEIVNVVAALRLAPGQSQAVARMCLSSSQSVGPRVTLKAQ